MLITRSGASLQVAAPAGPETFTFDTEAEAAGRQSFVEEALSWIGTPFVDCSDIKGPGGAVDCAMLLTRCAIDTGLVPAFDPRPYSPRWHVHRNQELFIDFLVDRLGAREIETPRLGDIGVWFFSRTYSHGAVILNSAEVVHAWFANRMVVRTRRDESLLAVMPVLAATKPRPVRYFDLWSVR